MEVESEGHNDARNKGCDDLKPQILVKMKERTRWYTGD